MRATLKQIWRFLVIANAGPGKWISLGLLALIVALKLIGIQVGVRMITWYADFYNALQKLDMQVATKQAGVFFLLAGCSAGLYLAGKYLRQHLNIRWRRRLTEVLTDRWLSSKAYWMLHPSLSKPGVEGGPVVDNPDQRIAEDCNIFVEFILGTDSDMRNGVLDFVVSLVGLVTFATVLWNLSTFPLSFGAFGYDIEIPRYMILAAPVYVVVSTGIAHLLGRPLPGLLAEQQKREADFRFSLMRLRENAGAVALHGGEKVEHGIIDGRFEALVRIWKRVINRELIFGLFQRPYFQTVLRIPMFIALPAFLAGHITLGGLMQVSQAFSNVVVSISWFIFNYKFISDLAATTKRLQVFLDAAEGQAERAPVVTQTVSADGTIRIRDFLLHAPDGRELLQIPNLDLAPGRHVWLSGPSGLGKSTLIKALAGLWPYASGDIETPQKTMFMPQQVYLPLGSLAAAAAYPADSATVPSETLDAMLGHVDLANRNSVDEGAGGLSIGEQQRLAMIRILAAEPDWVFIDEGTSALDLESENAILATLARLLPRTTFVMVAHREPRGLGPLQRVELQRVQLRATGWITPYQRGNTAVV